MEQRLTLVTLGVADLARSRAFYEALGWRASSFKSEDVVFFAMGTAALALYASDKLAADLGLDRVEARGAAVTLAWNGRSEREVDEGFALALQAGASPVKAPGTMVWGGYAGTFADPDGHVWEVAFVPDWPLDEDGRLPLPD